MTPPAPASAAYRLTVAHGPQRVGELNRPALESKRNSELVALARELAASPGKRTVISFKCPSLCVSLPFSASNGS